MPRLADSKKVPVSRPDLRASRAMVVFGFFLLFFLYVWLRIEPAVEYYSKGTVFYRGGPFLQRFLGFPGGLAKYAADFLAQLNHQNWLAALVFTALGLLLFLTSSRLCRLLTGRAPLFVCLAPSLVLLAWRGRYEANTLEAGLALLLVLGVSLVGWPFSRRPAWLRWPVWWAIGAALYYLAGLWPFLIFLFLVGWFEARQSRVWMKVAVVVLSGLLFPIAWHALPLPAHKLNPWDTGQAWYFASLLFLLLPAGFLILVCLPQPPSPSNDPATRRGKKGDSPNRNLAVAGWRLVGGGTRFAIGLLLAGWAVVWWVFNEPEKRLAQIEYYAARNQDEQLLNVATKLETLRPDVEIRVRLALYHRGQLTQSHFGFASEGSRMVLPGLALGVGAARHEVETLFELGQVNDAERMAQESLEFDGDRPDVLRLLAKINILKDRPKAAAVFLNALRQVPFQRSWADAYLAELETNPRLTGNQELDLVRSRMPTTDFPHGSIADAAEVLLSQLLASNPRNQMAFEYLMVQYLLDGEFQKLARHVGRLEDFGYTAIPRPAEEALLLGQKLQGAQFELHGLTIRPDSIRRFQSFCDAFGAATVPSQATLARLAADFHDTYWYYYYSRPSPQSGSPE